ncbi:MAG: GAF domain-containing protein [Algicola sp.]|nr:GAF domain-containing protein [Algicola sp.]
MSSSFHKALNNEDEPTQLLQLLYDINKLIATKDTLNEVFETLAELASKETGAQRSTVFLHDAQSGELFSRFAQGEHQREIRLLDNEGIAGHVFQSREGLIVDDAYQDSRFNPEVDKETGFKTNELLCAPIITVRGEIIGVIQSINCNHGKFNPADMHLIATIATQVAIVVQGFQTVEHLNAARTKELEFINIVSETTSMLELGPLLQKVMGEATRMLNAERSTLFLNNEKTNELWSQVGQGLDTIEIHFPNHLGIAGAVFTLGHTINIPYAYADLRFNPAFDKSTGFFTRSILCVPVINKEGKTIGVTQVLNKLGGVFNEEDESRLKAFTAQISIGLENAKLFDDVQNIKNYNESMLESMSNGVLTMDSDLNIVTINKAGLEILNLAHAEVVGQPADGIFNGDNSWLLDKVKQIDVDGDVEHFVDSEMDFGQRVKSLNITLQLLYDKERKPMGTMLLFEDISTEKRVKATMSRYVDAQLTEQLMADGGDILGGQASEATILFSDIRGFTSISESLGPQETVSMLNEYFTLMVDCIQKEGGMLDKFIGDAIMAAFGMPVSHDDDPDRAVRTAIEMMRQLQQYNRDNLKKGKQAIDIGIGINTDVVVSGNIGSHKRMDYTVIGDGVNLASRLESACKQYKARILISENTAKQLRGTYRMREVDRVVVKGQTKPVAIFEVLEYHNEESFPQAMEVIGHFKDGIQKYRLGEWDSAIAAFEQVLALNRQDALTEIYIERCHYFKDNPPSDDWDGVWRMTSK